MYPTIEVSHDQDTDRLLQDRSLTAQESRKIADSMWHPLFQSLMLMRTANSVEQRSRRTRLAPHWIHRTTKIVSQNILVAQIKRDYFSSLPVWYWQIGELVTFEEPSMSHR